MPINALKWACRAYAGLIAALLLTQIAGPERFPWGVISLFAPHVVWVFPALILLPIALWRAPHLAWMPALAGVAVCGPLMGFTWSLRSASAEDITLRVATYNVQVWQRRNIPAILGEIIAAGPDVLCLQDARGVENTRAKAYLADRHVATQGQYVVASRFPIIESVAGDISYDGRTHTYQRAVIDVRGRRVTILNAHFVTPRDALSGLRSPSLWRLAVSEIGRNQEQRLRQAQRLASDARAIDGPLIIAGDLNAPPSSLVTRTLTAVNLVDAFSEAGRGYGYTFGHSLLLGRSFLRLDRILVSRHLTPVAAWVGGQEGSDHRPVVSDLILDTQ